MNIGERIHDLRKKSRQSIAKLADKVGVSTLTLASWEKGETSPDEIELKKLAQALNVSIDTFLNHTEYYNRSDLLTNAYDDYKEKNKVRTIVLTIAIIIVVLIVGDTLLALALKRKPLLSWKISYLNGEGYVYKGLLMDSFYCTEDDEVTLKQKFKLSGFKCSNDTKKPEKSNKQVTDIRDTSKDKNGFRCSSAKEMFYEDDEYKYFLECTNSSYIIVTYYNDKTENIKSALENGKITIKDLDEYGIKYLKEEQKKTTPLPPDSEGYPKKEELELKTSLTFYLHKDYIAALQVTFKVSDDALILVDTGNRQKTMFAENVKGIAQRSYGSNGKAKLLVLTKNGDLYISDREINYDYKWDEEITFKKADPHNVESIFIEKNNKDDADGTLVVITSDGAQYYISEDLT